MDEPFAGVDAATERAILEVLRTLDAEGRTVICVHHDLQTVADYFAHVLMLNVTRIADGPVATTLTPETIQQTYRGRVHALELGFAAARSEEHTSELQSLMRISYAVFCLKKKNNNTTAHDK